jgi:hypothetical protein
MKKDFAWLSGAIGTIFVGQIALLVWLYRSWSSPGDPGRTGILFRFLSFLTLGLTGVIGYRLPTLQRRIAVFAAGAARAARLRAQGEQVRVLRGQRHDFANHLQVISGLAQLGKLDRLFAYIQEIAGESAGISQLAAVKPAEISTVLQIGVYAALTAPVPLELVLETDLSDFGADPANAGSLLDSVMDHLVRRLQARGEGSGGVLIKISETADDYVFALSGPAEVLNGLDSLPSSVVGTDNPGFPLDGLTVGACLREWDGRVETINTSDGSSVVALHFKKASHECDTQVILPMPRADLPGSLKPSV